MSTRTASQPPGTAPPAGAVRTRGPVRPPGKVGSGRTTWTLRRGGVALRVDRRAVFVCAVLAVVVAALGVLTLGSGSISLTPLQVLSALLDPDADPRARLVVVTWRLPRLLFAVVCGA
ncbi:iron-enterobactin ABC transporter permease, partial [Streptomyces sp. NPDC055107]